MLVVSLLVNTLFSLLSILLCKVFTVDSSSRFLVSIFLVYDSILFLSLAISVKSFLYILSLFPIF